MLRREAELRVSSEIQEAIEKAERSANSEWMDVIDMLQRSIVREFNANQKKGCILHLQDLREAALRFPEIAFWVKYNRARQGALRAGDIAPDVPLCRAQDGRETTLLALRY